MKVTLLDGISYPHIMCTMCGNVICTSFESYRQMKSHSCECTNISILFIHNIIRELHIL